MVEINWTHEAQVWLRDIHTYIAIDTPTLRSARLPESLLEFNSSKSILGSDTAITRRPLAKFGSFYMAIIVSPT